MKSKLYTYSFIIATVFLFSCKTAEKLYQKGRYDEAVVLAAKKLAKKPADAGLVNTIQNAYRFAISDHESRIRNLSNSSSDLRFENIYQEYSSLQYLYDVIHRSPSVFEIVQPTDYSSYLTTYKEEASNARYDRGQELLNQNTKNSSRDAYYEFQKALNLKPGDLSIQQKIDEAYQNAVTNVVLLPVTRTGFQYSSYYYDFNTFNYDMLRYLGNNNSNRFVKFYPATEAGSNNIRMDNAVDMRFSDVNIGRYRDQRNTREVTKQIVAKETVIKPDSIIKEYITVKAWTTTTTRSLKADGLLQASVKDYNNRRLWSDTYQGNYNWVANFATYTGDARALSEEDNRLLAQKEQWPPSNDEIIRIIMNEIQNKAQCGISDYFKRYN
jgi:hypothetical protein